MKVKFFTEPYLLFYSMMGLIIDRKKYKVRRIGLGRVRGYQYNLTNFILLNRKVTK
jgi:hypothetical protein